MIFGFVYLIFPPQNPLPPPPPKKKNQKEQKMGENEAQD